jgi:nanoRNase/pAp phosphatase (c-di-AMP/oligoRNAs hydrolase)
MYDEIKFVHPKDIQDGKVEVTENDILTNIPYMKGCGLWFDHHSSEAERNQYDFFEGDSVPGAPSAADVIYRYYGPARFKSPRIPDVVAAVNKADSGNFTREEILEPAGWPLLSFVMDARTGLGRYHDYRISNYALMIEMIDYCLTKTVDEILNLEDVKERTRRYFQQDALFKDMIRKHTAIRQNVIVTDLRSVEEIYTSNRFMVYSMYPEQNVSVQAMWGFKKQNVVITCGYSILNRTARTDIGSLMLKHGGGGHKQVGTCQVPAEKADKILESIVQRLMQDG